MKLAARRFFTSRRLWALLIVPAMLSAAYTAAAVVPTAQNAPPGPPVLAAVARGDSGIRNGNARGPVEVSAGTQPARPRTIQATAVPSRGGGGALTRLRLVKEVRNGDGGTASEGDWTLHAAGASTEGPTNLTGTSPVNSPVDFMADVYTLSETYNGSDPRVAASYTASAWRCVNNATAAPVGVTPDSKVVINYGDAVTCTITNSYITNSDTRPVPVARVRITGKKLYVAWEGPYKGGLVGLSGWVITATLVGAETIEYTTTTNALGEYEFSQENIGDMAFPGATIEVCEDVRDGWIDLTPPCVRVMIPNPLPPGYTGPVVDFTNAQAHSWTDSP